MESLYRHGVRRLLYLEKRETPPCDFERNGRCTLENYDRCCWACCPYNPRQKITVKIRIPDGRVIKRTLYPDGSISEECSAGLPSSVPEEFWIESLTPFRKPEFVANCIACGRPVTWDELLASQGNHCSRCWAQILASLARSKKRFTRIDRKRERV
jgi:hypothetical protein